MRAPNREKAAFFLGRLPVGRHSLRSEAPITNPRFIAFSREVVTNSLDEKRIKSEILEPGSEGPEPDKL